MKHIIILTFISLMGNTFVRSQSPTSQPFNALMVFADQKDFFTLRDHLEEKKHLLRDWEQLYMAAIEHNVFNRASDSNESIDQILKMESSIMHDSLWNKIYLCKQQNHINLYEYKEAAKCSQVIMEKYAMYNDSLSVADLVNEAKIWYALKDAKKQIVHRPKDSNVAMRRDKVGLFNVDISFGDSTVNLLFDTGANFSVMVRSSAEDLRLEIIDADFYVTAATGVKVESRIAVVPELIFGGLIIENSVFLILEDEMLSFPQIDYFPNGAIGFPIIEALEEIRISKDNEIFIPKVPIVYEYSNLALDGLMPVIETDYNGDKLRLNFDTGATHTSLYSLFYEDYTEEIQQGHELESIGSGSAGGTIVSEGYILNTLELKVADSMATLEEIRLYSKPLEGEPTKVHGNFGQDFIKQFDEMIISFKYASLSFK